LNGIQSVLQIPHLPDIGILNVSGELSGLRTFTLINSDLDELKDLPMTEELEEVEILHCQKLTNLNFLAKCKKLVKLKIVGCLLIASFNFLRRLLNIQSLTLSSRNVKKYRLFNGTYQNNLFRP
jgi:hypothetical protein